MTTNKPTSWKIAALPTLTLFTSAGTLICCALPALLVSLGMGAALAGLVSTVPQLIWLSDHKIEVFALSGIALVLSAIVQYKQRYAPCPADPAQAKACSRLRLLSRWILGVSVAIYAVGFFFAFLAIKVF